jgi:hypothetical protein
VGQDVEVKWTRAVHHLESLAAKCAELAGSPVQPLRVVRLLAVGDVLGEQRELDEVAVAIVVDLPAQDVPWLAEPRGAAHWANATRLHQNPIRPLWRSAHAPVWNHRIVRPAPLWDAATGVAQETLAALRDGVGERVREPAPTAEQLRARLADELAVSLRALREHTATYEAKRWTPGKLDPLADTLWRASAGYLDVLDACA